MAKALVDVLTRIALVAELVFAVLFGGELAWREALFEIRQQVGRKLGEDGPDLLESGAFLERCLIHVETAIDLDLQGMLAAMGRAMVLGDETTGIGLVPQHPEAVAAQRILDKA